MKYISYLTKLCSHLLVIDYIGDKLKMSSFESCDVLRRSDLTISKYVDDQFFYCTVKPNKTSRKRNQWKNDLTLAMQFQQTELVPNQFTRDRYFLEVCGTCMEIFPSSHVTLIKRKNVIKQIGILWYSGPWFTIKMLSYQYRNSHCGDKTTLRPSYLYNGISYPGKMTPLYWISPQVLHQFTREETVVVCCTCLNRETYATGVSNTYAIIYSLHLLGTDDGK